MSPCGIYNRMAYAMRSGDQESGAFAVEAVSLNMVKYSYTCKSACAVVLTNNEAENMTAKTLGCLFAAVMGLVTVARAETYSWTGAGDDNYWSTEKNWSGEMCPSSTDSIKPPVAPGEFTVDLENTTHTVSKLDFSSIYKSFAYPSIELRNGTLILSDGFDDPTGLDGSSYVDSVVMGENRTHPVSLVNATLKVQTKFMSGCPRTKGYMFTVGDGSSFILDHVNLYDKF